MEITLHMNIKNRYTKKSQRIYQIGWRVEFNGSVGVKFDQILLEIEVTYYYNLSQFISFSLPQYC